MSILLDTHALLWWLLADSRLSAKAQALIEDGRTERYVSSASAYEIANKVRIGKLDFARPVIDQFDDVLAEAGLAELPVSIAHSRLAGLLSGAPRDPFDRLIAAQSIIEGIPVLTIDPAFAALGAETLW